MSFMINKAYLSSFQHGTVDEPYQVFIKVFPSQLSHQGSRRRVDLVALIATALPVAMAPACKIEYNSVLLKDNPQPQKVHTRLEGPKFMLRRVGTRRY